MSRFSTIEPYLDTINELLAIGDSPEQIARKLGIPAKARTIRRYKEEVFENKKAAIEAWEIEKSKPAEQRIQEGKIKIIETLEVINLAKLRALQLLELEPGMTYKTVTGEDRTMSWGVLSGYWQTGAKMICDLARVEREIVGEDPESRKADAWIDLVDLLTAQNDE